MGCHGVLTHKQELLNLRGVFRKKQHIYITGAQEAWVLGHP